MALIKTTPEEAEKAEISVSYSTNILRVQRINRFLDDKSGLSEYSRLFVTEKELRLLYY